MNLAKDRIVWGCVCVGVGVCVCFFVAGLWNGLKGLWVFFSSYCVKEFVLCLLINHFILAFPS